MSKTCMHSLVAVLVLGIAPFAMAQERDRLFRIDARTTLGPGTIAGDGNQVIDLIDDFVTATGSFGALPIALGYSGELDYLGIPDAIEFDIAPLGRSATIRIPLIGVEETFTGANADEVAQEIENWIQSTGAESWADFMRAANGKTPLAVTSGNPKSTVALMGDGAYRRFGSDDSRSRFGYQRGEQRIGGVQLRFDLGGSSISTQNFKDDLYAIDGSLTLTGSLGRYVGISGSIIGQYRDYQGGQIVDLGLELAFPVTLRRPDRSEWFWQFTPVVQAAAGASIDLAAGGLFMGGGLVHSLGYHWRDFEFGMANEIMYYGGIPVEDIDGYDFDTKLSQLFFKNGLEATWHAPLGFYADVGVHFSHFAIDAAAVPWYATPAIGLGWRAGRWIDLRLAYEPDLGDNDYVAHNVQGKLNFLF